MGDVPQIAVQSVAAYILGYLNIETDILSPLEHPAYAYDKKRLQYNAGIILESLEPMPFDDYLKIVCLLDADLFVPILTYVYGEARQRGKHALISINRLKKNPDGSVPPIDLILERTAKIAFHELGHLFDLHHCMDKRCLMSFLATLKDLDDTPLYFCRYCTAFLREAI